MTLRAHNPASVFPPYRNYAHAVEVPAGARTLHISGLNGFDETGQIMPATFEEQITNVWRHLGNVLTDAGMDYTDLVSLRFFLTAADLDPANVDAIAEHLGDHLAARTVVVQQLLDPAWLVEVEAIAAKVD
ncbi:enamine deaminase RidA (YjgF/YER057c/UK114 family) [Kribbella amoyensis]|uniref:Enamine deaminase RidA (YjgF/YER057c/UK114 family) n=1 Tax=Kribbella amoyensis TaxID=996641 RepID=A0A561BPW9_9ACTN|nr:RidA family protein [Kribbella amoyensis]TWD80863.1 enamine deaminase RidA (YjgF/YER057c/UK114 family) [Kribbella amoyensis]